MRDIKYLTRYKKWMKTGKMHVGGLCIALNNSYLPNPYILLFKPRRPVMYNGEEVAYWGYDGVVEAVTLDQHRAFTPMRQNILLLIAAMAGEL